MRLISSAKAPYNCSSFSCVGKSIPLNLDILLFLGGNSFIDFSGKPRNDCKVTIWDHLDTLQSFLDLPEESIKEFPPETERISKLKNLGLPTQEKLEQLYGDFAEEIRRMPDVDIRPVTWFTRTPD